MRHRRTVVKLGRTAAHRDAMLRSLATDLLRHERVRTTLAKAKAVRRLADRMVTLGKRDTLHARRLAARVLRDPAVVRRLFDVLAPRYADRAGGYTRVLRLPARAGDGAEMAVVEMVGAEPPPAAKKRARKERKKAS